MNKTFLMVLTALAIIFLTTSKVEAKKVLPRWATSSTTTATPTKKTQGVNISVKFRGDRRAIVATFSNLGIASSVAYQLSYDAKGVPQGAEGEVDVNQKSATAEPIFGSCSKGVCTYDTNITNARFVVTTTLKNGTKIIKPFRLKV